MRVFGVALVFVTGLNIICLPKKAYFIFANPLCLCRVAEPYAAGMLDLNGFRDCLGLLQGSFGSPANLAENQRFRQQFEDVSEDYFAAPNRKSPGFYDKVPESYNWCWHNNWESTSTVCWSTRGHKGLMQYI